MKKKIIIAFAVIALVGVGFYVWNQSKEKEVVGNEDFAIVTEDTNKSFSIETQKDIKETIGSIDYSTLEKDRLYTEEEGKYENLSKVGKELLRSVLTSPKCVDDPNGVHCDESRITNSSIVAFKNNILLSNTLSIKGFSSYEIYNLNQKKIFIDSARSFWAQNKDSKFVVIVNNDYAVIGERLTTINQNLLYYKPGMGEFKLIPSSNMQSIEKESYLYNVGMNLFITEGNFKDHILTISIYDNKYMQFKEEYRGEYPPKKLREVTFNLNELE